MTKAEPRPHDGWRALVGCIVLEAFYQRDIERCIRCGLAPCYDRTRFYVRTAIVRIFARNVLRIIS